MDQWAERVTAWQRSGESAAAFSGARGWDPAQLRWWRWKLERTGTIPVRRGALDDDTRNRRAPQTFLRLVPRDGAQDLVTSTTAAPARCELVLRGGRTIRFDDAVDPARLRALADALEVRP